MSKINLYKFVAKDDLRPVVCGVYHDAEEKCAVASDSHILIMSRNDFDPAKAGKIISKNGDEISQERVNYPKWRYLVHTPEVLERDANPFPVEQFFKAVDNGSNFLKNAPQTHADGKKITKGQRYVHLHIKATYKGGDEVVIGLKYDRAKLIADLPREGAKMYFYSNRRAVEYVNEQTGIQVLLMPIIVDEKYGFKLADPECGIFNISDEELWTGCTVCTAFGDGKGLYRTPEKREPVKRAKCIQNGKGYHTAVTKHYPLADLKPIEQVPGFFYREERPSGVSWTDKYLYKLENGFFVCFGRMPSDMDKAIPAILQVAGMSVRQIVEERKIVSPIYDRYFKLAAC